MKLIKLKIFKPLAISSKTMTLKNVNELLLTNAFNIFSNKEQKRKLEKLSQVGILRTFLYMCLDSGTFIQFLPFWLEQNTLK